MKKVIALILIVLPLLLMVLISFMGRIYSTITIIDAERVFFADEFERELPNDAILIIDKNETLELKAIVKPDLASDKSVSYISMNEEVAKVNNLGVVTGIDYGIAHVTVKTSDGDYTDTITIKVGALNVKLVVIEAVQNGTLTDIQNLSLTVGESFVLRGSVRPITAANKNIEWTCNNSNVLSIDEKNIEGVRVAVIRAMQQGACIVTAKSEDGNHIANLQVTVTDGTATVKPITQSGADFTYIQSSRIYKISGESVDLLTLLEFSQGADLRANFTIESGKTMASLPYGTVLTCLEKNEIITISVLIESTGYYAELKILFE